MIGYEMATAALGATSIEDIAETSPTTAGQADMVVLNAMPTLRTEGVVAHVVQRTTKPDTGIV